MNEKKPQRPKIGFDQRNAKIWVVTAYLEDALKPGKYHSITKFDMTAELNAVLDQVYDKAHDHAMRGIKLKDRRKIITLVGSARFGKEFEQQFADFSAINFIVILPSCHLLDKSPGVKLIKDKDKFNDELMKAKIDLSDAIYVVNPKGYIGESTTKNIAYAKLTGKTVFYLVAPEEETEEIAGEM